MLTEITPDVLRRAAIRVRQMYSDGSRVIGSDPSIPCWYYEDDRGVYHGPYDTQDIAIGACVLGLES